MPQDKRNPPGRCRRASGKTDSQLRNSLPYSTPPNPFQLDPGSLTDWEHVGPIVVKIVTRAQTIMRAGAA